MHNLEHRHNAKHILLLIAALAGSTTLMAQTFTDHIRQTDNGKSVVTITQSADIEKLVNSRPTLTEKQQKIEQQTAKASKDAKDREKAKELVANNKPQHGSSNQNSANTANETNGNEMNIPTVDMRKKVMRNAYKVMGYRVQAYAGRNSKSDRMKAESVGNAIKMKYPDQPVYVHFYSPRWICRVGNYRSYEEAARMLKLIKGMGYSAATIVKGQITVKEK